MKVSDTLIITEEKTKELNKILDSKTNLTQKQRQKIIDEFFFKYGQENPNLIQSFKEEGKRLKNEEKKMKKIKVLKKRLFLKKF